MGGANRSDGAEVLISSPDWMDLLRCPETHQRLRPASSGLLQLLRATQAAGNLTYSSGKPVEGSIEAGLLREDGEIIYLIRGGIPVLTMDEAVIVTKTA